MNNLGQQPPTIKLMSILSLNTSLNMSREFNPFENLEKNIKLRDMKLGQAIIS